MDKAIARYAELRVPRYTSYPTAPYFDPAADDAGHRGWLDGLDPAAPVSLYLHVPFCKKVCWYCACNMKLAAREAPVRAYGKALEKEIALVAKALPARLAVSHVHWGGGTPTAMPMDALAELMGALRFHFEVRPGAEIAFELDPRTFKPEFAAHLAEFGATRASLGVQEFDAKVQETVNRIQPFEVVKRTVDALRDAGIGAINFDLMYGLPHQTRETIARSVEQTLTLRPDRIALFGYAHVPWMAKNQRLIPEEALPGASERFDQAERAAEALTDAGYIRIGLDHFALPGDEMVKALAEGRLKRNFQGYTVDDAETLIGLGATSISALPESYVQNIAETGAWSRAIDAGRLPTGRTRALTAEDRLRRAVIERLMCDLTVDVADIATRHGVAPETFAPELDRASAFVAEGLATRDGSVLSVTERGRPALRVVAALFDAYLPAQQTEKRHAAAV
ncbi:MAG: oxygen-independent coproporphyrinogen III oxidase [Alphaproteobacteria bacterium]|nr:oxygen-independent coproporphyrinogen III oxidase [Alphaproteobacteria bacterium]